MLKEIVIIEKSNTDTDKTLIGTIGGNPPAKGYVDLEARFAGRAALSGT